MPCGEAVWAEVASASDGGEEEEEEEAAQIQDPRTARHSAWDSPNLGEAPEP